MIKKRILKVGLALPLYGNKSRLIVSLEPTTDGANFALSPISYERKANPEQQTTQWYLKFIGSLKVKLDLLLQPNNTWQPSDVSLTYSQENPLTLILEEGKETAWILRQGSIQVPLSLRAPTDNILQSLWPTGEIKTISALVIQSGGLYLQGKLPQPFYPITPQDVLLRIPQTKEDTKEDTNDPNNLGKVSAFWTLDALPFGENHTAVKHIKGFAQQLSNVRLKEPGPDEPKRRLNTFIDDVDCQPDAQSKIQIFQTIGKPVDRFIRQLTWLTLRPNTRITLGGQGTAEASFTPKVLRGQLQQPRTSQKWELESIEWRAQDAPLADADSDFRLELSTNELNPTVVLKKTDVQALSIPVSELTTDENRYRSWMCLTEGWLRVDTSAREAIIDPEKATQGTISGVLELTPLIRGLQPQDNSSSSTNDSPSLMVQIQTLNNHPVVLRQTDTKLSLQIKEPMVVLITPAVWYQETVDNQEIVDNTVETSLGQNFIPTLITQSANPDEIDKPELLLKKRLGQGTFISENVIKSLESSDNPNQGIPVKGFIDYDSSSKSFRLSLSQGVVEQEKGLKQDILIWQRPINYPVVQSFPLSPTRNTGSFLDSNRGLIPYQLIKDEPIVVQFPSQGLPRLSQSPIAKDKPIASTTDWKLVTSLLTSRYFLPTLPGIEIDLNANPEIPTWLYRHSVPVLDEAYAEVQESESTQITNTGNVQGQDFTRVEGTKAFNIVPASTQATGWLPKTAANSTGEIGIEFPENEQARLQGLQGRFPVLKFKLENLDHTFTLNRDRFDPEGKVNKTSGGLTLPLKFTSASIPNSILPEFKIKPDAEVLKNPEPNKQPFGILNEGQPLLAGFVQNRIVTHDAEGLIQEEVIGEINSYKLLDKTEQRRCTRSFKLLEHMILEVRGVRLGKFPEPDINDDLQQQSWMLHDEKGAWPTLGGFPIYPLRLAELTEKNGQYTLQIQGIWLPSIPIDRVLPNNASQLLTLTFVGNEQNWQMTVKGGIDWSLKPSEETNETRLVQLQAKIEQTFTNSEEFELKDLILAILFPLGLLELEIEKQESPKTKATITKSGELKIQFPTLGSGELDQQYEIKDLLAFNLGSITIQVNKPQEPLSFYEFRWLPQGLLATDNGVDKNFFLKISGQPGQEVQLTAKVIQRRAFFKNEFGLFWVDDPDTGSINGLTPGQSGYAKAALGRRLLTVTAQADENTASLPSQKWITGYLIQNGTTKDFLDNNPNNDPNKQPIAFFPFKEANPDKTEHLISQKIPQGIQLAWEDVRSGGDQDFDDLVISLTLPLFWELSLISSDSSQEPQWKLEIGKENDLPLIALPLVLYPLGEKKFILATKNQSPLDELQQQPFFLPQREPESAIIALEVSEKASDFRNLIADIQLRLKDKDEQTNPEIPLTRLTIRLLLNLLTAGSDGVLEAAKITGQAEITGQWVLKNNIPFKTEALQTSECQHQVTFYCDQAKVSTLDMFSLLRGRGPSKAIAIGTIAEHKLTLKGKSYIWQAAQPLWLTTLGQVADTLLGIVERSDSRRILFPIDSVQVNSNDPKLKQALKILKENPGTTAKLLGFASADGDSNSNQVFSEQRAEAVRQFLIQQKIDPARLTAQGMGEISSGNPAENRRTDIIIFSVKRPTIPPGQLPSLAIEAGAVFELRESKSKLLSSPPDGSADIENSSLRLLIRSLLRDAADQTYILRIPFVFSFIASDVSSKLWPPITLANQPEQPIFRDQRSLRSLESPKISSSSDLSNVDIFKRTEQAQWLNSETLKHFLGIAELNLKPVFVDKEDQLTFRLPDTLGDFAPFLKLTPSSEQMAIILKASTLIGFSDLMLEPSYLTVFDYPFEVTSLNLEQSGKSKINLQLVSFIGGRLQQLSQDVVKSDTDILQWGRQRLEAKRRYEAAIVWQNFNSASVLIPRPFEIVQQDQVDFPQVTALNPETPTDLPYGQAIDPRCRLPELIEKDTSLVLSAEPNLGLVVFEASPLVPIKTKSIAATRFRLSPTGTQIDWAGKLRSPQISPVASRQLLGCSKWDQVNFEQVTTLKNYPSANPQSVNQPTLPLLKSLPDQEGRTLVPPLIDIVAWAARPGETTRSLWSLEKLTYQEKLHQQAGTHPISVSLRRPRAVAGFDESVRLNVLNSRILNQQFFYASLQLTQVLGTTPLPPDGSIYGVAVSKRNFYPSQPDLNQAANSPALFYYKKAEDSKKIDLESLELYAIASKEFMSRKQNSNNKPIVQTALLWNNTPAIPDWKPNDPKEDDADPRSKNWNNVLIDDLPNPSDLQPWKNLFKVAESEAPKIADIRRINLDSMLRKGLKQSNLRLWLQEEHIPSNQSIYLILIQYKVKNPDRPEDEWIWEVADLWSNFIAFLDQKSSIIAPKMGIGLLTVPNQTDDTNSKIKDNTLLSGYGRLDDDDFSPIQPFATETSVAIDWIRIAGLKTLDRLDTDNLGDPPYDYDVVVYGSGGELIPFNTK